MSVTTTTENESFELQETASDGSRKQSPGIRRSGTTTTLHNVRC